MDATINQAGAFGLQVSRVSGHILHAQIIRLVQWGRRPPGSDPALRRLVAGCFVPAVMAIATCSSALELATPLSVMIGTGEGARRGPRDPPSSSAGIAPNRERGDRLARLRAGRRCRSSRLAVALIGQGEPRIRRRLAAQSVSVLLSLLLAGVSVVVPTDVVSSSLAELLRTCAMVICWWLSRQEF